MKIKIHDHGVALIQLPLIQKILTLANTKNCKHMSSPLPASHSLYQPKAIPSEEEELIMSTIPYQEVLGALLFISTRTRPDISTAVSMLGTFSSAPQLTHWKAMKHLLHYISYTKVYGLHIRGENHSHKSVHVMAWSDADWARDQDHRRSRSGFLVQLNGQTVIWC